MSQTATARAPEVLASIAQELEHAGELCDRLETLVTQLVRASRGEPLAIALHEAQTLDVLTQHLAALATFTRKLSSQAESEVYDLMRGPQTTADRVKQLQAEARALAIEQVEALEKALNDAAALADEISKGGDAYPVGAREIASRLAEDLPAKAETIKVIVSRLP